MVALVQIDLFKIFRKFSSFFLNDNHLKTIFLLRDLVNKKLSYQMNIEVLNEINIEVCTQVLYFGYSNVGEYD